MSCGIYKIENLINHKIYIGKAKNIDRRWSEHKNNYKNSKKNHTPLYRAMNKYGLENFSFSIIEECQEDNEILFNREQYWIDYYNSYEEGYNQTRGGEGKFCYKISDIRNLWDQGFCSKEIQDTLGCGDKVIHQALIGYNNYTVEESQLRSAKSAGHREKLSKIALKRWGTGPIYQYDLNGIFLNEYNSMSEAAKSLGKTKDHSIYKALNYNDRSNMAYGYLWSKEKVEKMPPYVPTNGRCVKNVETEQIFYSYRKAAQWAKCVPSTLKKACEKGSPAGKHPNTQEPLHWEYI